MSNQWIKINGSFSLPPKNVIVQTKIEDNTGTRNEQELIYDNNLWWDKNKSMYVYYKPTHWRFKLTNGW